MTSSNAFDMAMQRRQTNAPAGVPTESTSSGKGNAFDLAEQQRQQTPDSGLQKAARWALQPAMGAISAIPSMMGAEIGSSLSRGKQLRPEAYQALAGMFGGTPEQAQQNVTEAGKKGFQQQLESDIERSTGIPLEARTPWQKALRVGGLAGSLGKGAASVAIRALGGTATTGIAQEVGVPEGWAEVTGLGASSWKELAKLPGALKDLAIYGFQKAKEGMESLYKTSTTGSPFAKTAEEITPKTQIQTLQAPQKPGEETLAATEEAISQKVKPIGEKAEDYEGKYALGKAVQDAEKLNLKPNVTPKEIGLLPTNVKFEHPGKKPPLAPLKSGEKPKVELEVGKPFAAGEFESQREAGERIKAYTMAADEKYNNEVVKPLYDLERQELQNTIVPNEVMENAFTELDALQTQLEDIAVPSTAQKGVIETIKKLKNRWRTPLEEAEGQQAFTINEISARQLSEQIQAIRSEISQTYEHGDANNIFKLVIEPLDEALTSSASSKAKAYHSAAVDAFKEGHDLFRKSKYVRKLLNKNEINFSDLYEEGLKTDNVAQLKAALENSPAGKHISDYVTQKFFESQVEPLIQKGVIQDRKKFNKVIQEVRSTLTEDERPAFDQEVARLQKESNTNYEKTEGAKLRFEEAKQARVEEKEKRAAEYKAMTKEQKENQQRIKAEDKAKRDRVQAEKAKETKPKYANKKPEEIARDVHTISGLVEMEKTLLKTPGDKELVGKVKSHVAGNIITSEPLAKVMADKEKKAVLRHILGSDTVNDLELLAKRGEDLKEYRTAFEQFEKDSAKELKLRNEAIEKERELTEKEIKQYKDAKERADKGILSRIWYKKKSDPSTWWQVGSDLTADKAEVKRLSKVLTRLPKTSPEMLSPESMKKVYNAVIIALQSKEALSD